ncbi:Nitroreductase [Sporobacter termitidis DSM 10068]|uniref:Nitroreductase n=1 Tax=Sporobacter termitidis DSM 10068 TaxID=1123282 RepID=A0A1M5WWN4_9FIRM|nr:nitroreductase [Sporobacter termitidis]SHH92056.1 Nitroreductase [Sporobacter termitidis DSM 10068]
MNETLDTLLNRRSIRKFKAEQISDSALNAVLEAGRYAPSGGNQQSAIFVVIQSKDELRNQSRMNAAVIGKDGIDPYYGAPTIIHVLAEKDKITPVEDAALALGNMLNAAHALGLGSCWIHRAQQMFESDEGKALLKKWGVTGDYVGVGTCILGYPDMETPKAAPRKENAVFFVK